MTTDVFGNRSTHITKEKFPECRCVRCLQREVNESNQKLIENMERCQSGQSGPRTTQLSNVKVKMKQGA